jgi:galactitol-specific phosphotransferase system IIC component
MKCHKILQLTTTTTTITTTTNDNHTKTPCNNNNNTKRGARFRQTGIFGSNILVGAVLGIISGKYIFEEPLQRYWADKHAAEAASASIVGKLESDGASGGDVAGEKAT